MSKMSKMSKNRQNFVLIKSKYLYLLLCKRCFFSINIHKDLQPVKQEDGETENI